MLTSVLVSFDRDLTRNHIEVIEDGAFDNLLDLTTLNLTHNKLKNVSGGLIANNIHMKELYYQFPLKVFLFYPGSQFI